MRQSATKPRMQQDPKGWRKELEHLPELLPRPPSSRGGGARCPHAMDTSGSDAWKDALRHAQGQTPLGSRRRCYYLLRDVAGGVHVPPIPLVRCSPAARAQPWASACCVSNSTHVKMLTPRTLNLSHGRSTKEGFSTGTPDTENSRHHRSGAAFCQQAFLCHIDTKNQYDQRLNQCGCF